MRAGVILQLARLETKYRSHKDRNRYEADKHSITDEHLIA